jgi:hypothetical protein
MATNHNVPSSRPCTFAIAEADQVPMMHLVR